MAETEKCMFCGTELNDKNCVGVTPVCLDCQSRQFAEIEETNGCHIAIFLTCAAFNFPCDPLTCPVDLVNFKGDRWREYVRILEKSGKLIKNGVCRTFLDGETDFLRIFGRKLSQEDFGRYVAEEQKRIAALEGTAEQRERWGTADGYTTDEYNELDRMYNNRLANYRDIDITPQMDYTLSETCKWQLLADKLRRKGDIKGATDALKAVDNMLASENMRKKDEKQTEAMRVDALIIALENAGLMENGDFLSWEETVAALRDKFVKSKKYDYSLDVADQIIFDIYNNMRANADMPLLETLDDSHLCDDEYGEFEAEETELEKQNKKYAGLVKLDHSKNKKNG